MQIRLHKYLANCGVASRRQCEQLMAEGRVSVDGVVIREVGAHIDPDRQEVKCDGKTIKPEQLVYIALNKPPGHVCTSRDPQGRPLVIDLLPAEFGRIYTIGRLDTESEGLILLTNDGDFAHRVSHPRFEIAKIYDMWLHTPLMRDEQAQWLKGFSDNEEILSVKHITELPPGRGGYGYRVTLGEGRNRHLRRMAARFDKKVLRLLRIAVGPLNLGDLKRAAWRHLTKPEVAMLSGQPASQNKPSPVKQKVVNSRSDR
jgi:23S rRNA pseudouridine2605 synthase